MARLNPLGTLTVVSTRLSLLFRRRICVDGFGLGEISDRQFPGFGGYVFDESGGLLAVTRQSEGDDTRDDQEQTQSFRFHD